MENMIKNQYFGIEIELTGLTRRSASEVIATYFQTRSSVNGNGYVVKDSQGRSWQVVRDGSINCQKKVNGQIVSAGDEYSVEMVSPKCKYEDIETVQEIVRLLRKAGAIANSSCGIHVHIDASNHNAKTLKNVINIMASKEDMIYRALQIEANRERRYCKKVNSSIVEKIKASKNLTMVELSDIWYDGYYGDRNRHYHDSRYFGLNLHATFSKGTVEFRLFNGTTHAGKIKAYIQFCLAISNQAIQQKSASSVKTESSNEKYTFRTWLLRLGLIGDEFKTCREHLLANLEGDIAWRNGRQAN